VDAELTELEGATQARRSITGGLITLALFALAGTLLIDGPARAFSILAAGAALFFAARGLPRSLVDSASQRRGPGYLKILSFVVPIGLLLLSGYIAWLLLTIQSSELPIARPSDIALFLLGIAGVVNLAVIGANIFARN